MKDEWVNMKKLLIVESPAKIKTISKFLGSDFKIMSTIGHIKDLPEKKIGVKVGKDDIEIEYVVMKDKEKVIKDIVDAAKKSEAIYLAPDPDREGEIIAWHIGNEIAKVADEDKIFRITYNEITKPAILEAIDHPSRVDMKMVSAQQARRVLDRWVGYEVSPVLWKKITKGLSAGRVQSVTLKFIVDREEEIRNFKVEEYWSIDGMFQHHNKDCKFNASLLQINGKKLDVTNKEDADKIVAQLKKTDFSIESIKDKKRTRNPYAAFETSSLQQAAFNTLGFSVKKTMEVAQKLYEGMPLEDASTPVALITYMRTDSLRIADTALKQVRDHIKLQYGKDYLPTKANVYSKKGATNAQDAHEAIRPIDTNLSPDKIKKFLTLDAYKLYNLIWKRFVASQMTSAEYAQRQVTVIGDKFTFKVTGSTLIFDGFLKVFGETEEEDDKETATKIPADLKENDAVSLNKIDPKQHFTQPPPRYTEASLVKRLKEEGIGRPSTYATIMNTIRARSYTNLDEKKRFVPTELGFAVTNMLNENLPKIMDAKFTANMEEDLDKIAQGELQRDDVLRGFYTSFQKDLKAFKGAAGKTPQETDITCPECKKHKLLIRFGKTGEFLGCSGYPECKFTSNFKRDEQGNIEFATVEAPKLLEEKCPNCGKPLRVIKGRYGEFIACSGYPECKYIHLEKASFKCPTCGVGDIVKRKWKGRTFWGCSKYPECKFVIFADIEDKPCPKCKLPYLVKVFDKSGNYTLRCSDTKCGYKE